MKSPATFQCTKTVKSLCTKMPMSHLVCLNLPTCPPTLPPVGKMCIKPSWRLNSTICITGWGFWTQVQLVRGQDQDTRTLGQILVDKVKEGVKVWVMVWKEMTTKEWGISEGYSLMGTHDVKTFKFFENTGVHCFLAPR